jgi:energy-coupling factor transporter ATP-binding protein EcfA2
MDEPTASLGDREVDRLFDIIRGLRAKGIAVVYISHKLDEVFRLADRITVLRDGHTVGTVATASTSQDDLIAMMVGRRLGHVISKASHASDRVVLEVESMATDTGLADVSFTLRRGEVLGVYGLLGSGRTGLARALFGADPIREGVIRIDGEATGSLAGRRQAARPGPRDRGGGPRQPSVPHHPREPDRRQLEPDRARWLAATGRARSRARSSRRSVSARRASRSRSAGSRAATSRRSSSGAGSCAGCRSSSSMTRPRDRRGAMTRLYHSSRT